MKKITVITVAIWISVVLACPVCAVETTPAAEPAQDQLQQDEGAATVSPAQLELMKKREEAKQRRDEMLKKRQTLIESSGQGGSGAPQLPQQ